MLYVRASKGLQLTGYWASVYMGFEGSRGHEEDPLGLNSPRGEHGPLLFVLFVLYGSRPKGLFVFNLFSKLVVHYIRTFMFSLLG